DDQDHAGAGMGNVDRTGHRSRGTGAGDLHADRGFHPRLQRLCRQGKTCVRGELMADRSFLDWPFFEPHHRDFARYLDDWASGNLTGIDHADTDSACRRLVADLVTAGCLQHTASPDGTPLDVLKLALSREILARHD